MRFATRLVNRKPIMGACGLRSTSNVGFEELTVRSFDGNSFIFLPVFSKDMTTAWIVCVSRLFGTSFLYLLSVSCLASSDCEPSKDTKDTKDTTVAWMWIYLPFRDGPMPHSVDRKELPMDGIPSPTCFSVKK